MLPVTSGKDLGHRQGTEDSTLILNFEFEVRLR